MAAIDSSVADTAHPHATKVAVMHMPEVAVPICVVTMIGGVASVSSFANVHPSHASSDG